MSTLYQEAKRLEREAKHRQRIAAAIAREERKRHERDGQPDLCRVLQRGKCSPVVHATPRLRTSVSPASP